MRELLVDVLGWCLAMNITFMAIWFFFFVVAHDFMFRMHRKLFRFSVESFDTIHYVGFMIYKLLVILLILVPYLALRIAG